jgi:hypothetical protein
MRVSKFRVAYQVKVNIKEAFTSPQKPEEAYRIFHRQYRSILQSNNNYDIDLLSRHSFCSQSLKQLLLDQITAKTTVRRQGPKTHNDTLVRTLTRAT